MGSERRNTLRRRTGAGEDRGNQDRRQTPLRFSSLHRQGAVAGGGDDPARPDHRAGAVQAQFAQVHAVGADLVGQGLILADQQDQAVVMADPSQQLRPFTSVRFAEMPVNDAAARGQMAGNVLGMADARGIGDEDQRRQRDGMRA